MYAALVRVAPAPYALDMRARAAFDRGDLATARSAVLRLPEGDARSEWLARLELARGNSPAARAHFIEAGDAASVQSAIDALARTDNPIAVSLERSLIARLQRDGRHPDSVADATWHLGVLYARAYDQTQALAAYRQAARLSPLAAKYVLAAGYQELTMRRYADAGRDFARALDVDPGSADAYAGAGLVALHDGNRTAAQRYAQRARALDPHSEGLRALLQALK